MLAKKSFLYPEILHSQDDFPFCELFNERNSWTEEIVEILGEKDGNFCQYYGIYPGGNFKEKYPQQNTLMGL